MRSEKPIRIVSAGHSFRMCWIRVVWLMSACTVFTSLLVVAAIIFAILQVPTSQYVATSRSRSAVNTWFGGDCQRTGWIMNVASGTQCLSEPAQKSGTLIDWTDDTLHPGKGVQQFSTLGGVWTAVTFQIIWRDFFHNKWGREQLITCWPWPTWSEECTLRRLAVTGHPEP